MIKRIFILIFVFICCFQTAAKAEDTIVIGSKNFTEQVILGEIMAQLIESKTNLTVKRKFFLGGSHFTFVALKNGDIDIYPEYTGTGLMSVLKHKPLSDSQRVYDIVKKEFKNRYQIDWLKPFGFNNTYALAVRQKDKRVGAATGLSEISDLAPKLVFGAPHEFLDRPDGFKGLVSLYNLKFKKFVGLDPGIMYTALKNKEVDMITAFSTDGRIQKFNLVIIKDDLNYFPPYFAAPLVRQEVLKKHPELKQILNLLHLKINDKEMTRMNYLADVKAVPVKTIAKNFLQQKNLILPSVLNTSEQEAQLQKLSLLNYFWQQRYYLLRLTKEHMVLVLISLLIAASVGLPLGIFLTRHPKMQASVFGLINIVQTIPSIALLGFLIPILGIGIKPTIVALFLYALLPLVRNTYAGIHDIDQHYIEVAKGLGLTDWQILTKIQIPLALPTIMAGIRISTVIMVGTATLAALIGAGGLGDPIFRGISSINNQLILLGAIPSAILAIALDRGLHIVEKRFVSGGINTKPNT
jgi:osmoprotectant transport system permease protein